MRLVNRDLKYLVLALAAPGVVILAEYPSHTWGEHPQLSIALTAADCGAPAVGELPNERFLRKGGRSLRVPVHERHGILTADGVEQGRQIGQYDRLDLHSKAVFAYERPHDPTLAEARLFLWRQWTNHRLGYLNPDAEQCGCTEHCPYFCGRGLYRPLEGSVAICTPLRRDR
jgi:hypothetical protein